MKRGMSALAVTCILCLSAAWPARASGAERSLSWRRTPDTIALLNGDEVVWKLHCQKGERPYFHPVALPDGTVLTNDEPSDHPYHDGLWFAWKYINGAEYWAPEVGPRYGFTHLREMDVRLRDDFSARIAMRLEYVEKGADEPVLTERREIQVSAPDPHGAYRMRWTCAFEAPAHKVKLSAGDAGPDHLWGGHAGMNYRTAEGAVEFKVIDSRGRGGLNVQARTANVHTKRSKGVDFSLKNPNTGGVGGVTMLECPRNPRYPAPWFVINEPSGYGFLESGFLYREPYAMEPGSELTLRYGIVIHPGRYRPKDIKREWKSFYGEGAAE